MQGQISSSNANVDAKRGGSCANAFATKKISKSVKSTFSSHLLIITTEEESRISQCVFLFINTLIFFFPPSEPAFFVGRKSRQRIVVDAAHIESAHTMTTCRTSSQDDGYSYSHHATCRTNLGTTTVQLVVFDNDDEKKNITQG